MNNDNKIYDAALYLRLSRDDVDIDGKCKTESNSISSQRELLREFVKQNEDLQIFDIYVDDGYSGSNFDRPEFKRMKEDIEARKVNCVIVKDLSRFGREYIEAGRLIEKIFPALNVRFIAVTDNYDSKTADKTESAIVLPVKNFINDSYCRDISQKVRTQKKTKYENGEFIGAFASYGYMKDAKNRYHLVIDTYAGEIVKNIYAMKIEGISMNAIAKRLNSQHVLSPSEYKRSTGSRFECGFGDGARSLWSVSAIHRILTDEIYLGTLIQGKRERISYKVKKDLIKPEQEWYRTENAHEALISKADFEIVQRLLKYDGRASREVDASNIFVGILMCGDCDAPMIRRVNQLKDSKKVFYICQTKNKGQGCSRHSIDEETLKTIVLKEIRLYTSVFIEHEALLEQLKDMEVGYDQVIEYDSKISEMQEDYTKYFKMKSNLIEDLRDGIITKEEFEEYGSSYEKKCQEILCAMEAQKSIIKELFKEGVSASVQLEQWKKGLDIGRLSRALLITAVSKIRVFEDKKIEITFRYQNVVSKMLVIENFIRNFVPEEV